ncbi:alpha-2-macroglobulin family protein [Gaoshiqia sediminis]|uniref:MG2 domain-containing protein n=1 Tax=Gaoshiqia sediminis TaxID=2986998 RepID=A0AA42C8E7_9BACT|nr:MG2 domain-containing protein [Gaoshiqia sediminis]MCW0482641.1 MG2 domain-containing protein [Gaoshiqia sediminis]
MKLAVRLAVILITALHFLPSCGDKKTQQTIEVDSGFTQFVSSYTSGVISCKAPILITFSQEPQNPGQPGTEAPAGLISLSPSVKGKIQWVDNQTLAFLPSERMKSDAAYTVTVALGKILDVPSRVNTLQFQVKTIRQSFNVNNLSIRAYDNENLKLQFLSGQVFTADFADEKQVEALIRVLKNNQPLSLSWTHDAEGKNHVFRADSLVRINDPQKLAIKWDGGAIGDAKKGMEEMELPALDVFKVVDVRVVQQPEQYLLIRFSDPLLANQNLEGLVSIDKIDQLRYLVENNELKIYVPSRLAGEHDVYISSGIRNALNFKLKEPTTLQVRFEDLKPAVRLVGKGSLVPSSNELIFPFEAVNLNAVDLRIIQIFTHNIHQFFQQNNYPDNSNIKQVGRLVFQKKVDLNVASFSQLKNWNTYTVDIAKLVKIEPGAIYRVQLGFRKDYSLYGLEEMPAAPQTSPVDMLETAQKYEEEMDEWNHPGWYSDYYYPDDYEWEERENPDEASYYNSGRFVARNLFATNLGIIAKGGSNQQLYFAVTNLKTTAPETGVNLKIYSFQKQLMETVVTGADGLAKVQLKHKPFLLVAEKDGQLAYLRLDDGSSLSLSNFDVSGEVVQKGTKGYIYGERGVWRPGDKIFLTFLLEDKQNNLPDNHPVIFELINPKGQTVSRQVKTAGMNGFYCFTAETDPEAPTGNWNARLKVGGQTFSKRIKVETVKPNRLKIDLKFEADPLSIYQGYAKGTLKTAWLHGGTAKNLKAKVSLSFSKTKTTFAGLFNYNFDDPAKEFYAEEQAVFSGKVDDKGLANINFKLPQISSAPGMLNAHFSTRVYEETGDFSIDMKTVPYAPYPSFVGVKLPASDSNWYKIGTSYPLDLVTVDYKGQKVDRKELEVTVYKVDWHWWWDAGEDNLARYVNNSYKKPVMRKMVSTVNGTASIPLQINYTDWNDSGRYLIHVKDRESGHSTGITAYFSKWGYWAAEGMQHAATMLSFKTDKEKYHTGEKVTVTIPSGKNGKALVSIENGSDVLDLFWVETTEKNTVFSFDTKPEMAPNIFVHISLIQPHAQTKNDAPIRLYGVIPVLIEDPNTHLTPVISMPDELAPEKAYEVKVSEKNGQRMTYTLAVVDEGLLDLTRFKTPDPWPAFYAREALGVKTWDFYDDVIGAYGARLERAFAVGGDENLAAAKRKKVNRFKPVVSFIGPFTLEKGKTSKHSLQMPNYVGAVRVMVVSGNNGAYGNAEKSVKVLKPLMLLATLPRVLGPGEEVKLPVNVFAMKPEVKNVKISIQTNELLTPLGGSSRQVQFTEVGDQLAGFNLKVAEKTGIGKVTVTAESGSHKASYDIEIEIRPSNPRVVNMLETIIQPGQKWETAVLAPGMEGTNTARLELSGIPPIDLGRRLHYLIHYPHGCIEQVTSGAFPQLMLNRLTEISPGQKQETESNIRAALNLFTRFQLNDGSFAYWPGSQHSSLWGTNYAGHFMLKAEEAGYTLPFGLKEKWLNYQKNAARNWQRTNEYERSPLIQAYRLYTLALAQSPDFGAMNRLREEKELDQLSQWRLAAAYAVAGQPEVAEKMISKLSKTIKPYRELSNTYGSDARDRAMILETLALLKKQTEAFPLLTELSAQLSSDEWMSTQTTAFALVAIAEFAGDGKPDQTALNAKVSFNKSIAETISANKPVWQGNVTLKNNKTAQVQVENQTSKVMYARVMSEGIPVTGDTTSAQSNLFMELRYTDMQGQKIDPARLAQGTDFVAEISVQNPGQRGIYKEMALTTIFPSGWEIINARLNDVDSPLKSDAFDYQDIRDDRVLTYFSLNPHERKTFRILLNAAYEGKFYLPSVQCEAMYDNRINSRKPGQWVEMVK